VLDRVFKNHQVRPLLPDYYPSPQDVQVQREILHNIRTELQQMNVLYSSGKLARKCSIIEAAMSEFHIHISRYQRILGSRKENFVAALGHRHSASTHAGAAFQVPMRNKRGGGILDSVKAAVILWWTEETRVSPNVKDVYRKRLGRNMYDTYPAHLLQESQVSSPFTPF
jgi:hypothetical protein